MAYYFDIKYTWTDEFGHANVLLRLISKQRKEAEDDWVIAEVAIQQIFVNQLNEALPISFKEIVAATKEDLDCLATQIGSSALQNWVIPKILQRRGGKS